jgi:hypothetical protein
MKAHAAPTRELINWLTIALRGEALRDLPAYPEGQDGAPSAAEDVARDLVQDLNGASPRTPIGLIEARAFRFRAWVETQPGWSPEATATARRRPEDPTGRGLNIGKSLRVISKSAAAGEWPDEFSPPPPAPETGSSWSLRVLIALFVLPLLLGLAIMVAQKAPQVVGWGLAGLGSLGVLALLARMVPDSALRTEHMTDAGGPSGEGSR